MPVGCHLGKQSKAGNELWIQDLQWLVVQVQLGEGQAGSPGALDFLAHKCGSRTVRENRLQTQPQLRQRWRKWWGPFRCDQKQSSVSVPSHLFLLIITVPRCVPSPAVSSPLSVQSCSVPSPPSLSIPLLCPSAPVTHTCTHNQRQAWIECLVQLLTRLLQQC